MPGAATTALAAPASATFAIAASSLTFAAYQLACPTVLYRHHRRSADHVVVRRHAVVIGAGAGHGEQVAGVQVRRELDIASDLVAGLAVSAGHGDALLDSQWMPVRQRHRVLRAVQRHPRVVAHSAVYRNEGAPARLRLDRAHPVQGDAGPAADAPTGLDHDGRPGEMFRGAGFVQCVLDDVGQLFEVEFPITGDKGDRMAAADVEFGQNDAVPGADVGHGGDHPANRLAVQRRIGHLRADMAVQPDQVEDGMRQHPAYRVGGVSLREGEAELLVADTGGDRGVSVDVDVRGHPDEHRLPPAGQTRDVCDLDV